MRKRREGKERRRVKKGMGKEGKKRKEKRKERGGKEGRKNEIVQSGRYLCSNSKFTIFSHSFDVC